MSKKSKIKQTIFLQTPLFKVKEIYRITKICRKSKKMNLKTKEVNKDPKIKREFNK
jgi:hypothetical protein